MDTYSGLRFWHPNLPVGVVGTLVRRVALIPRDDGGWDHVDERIAQTIEDAGGDTGWEFTVDSESVTDPDPAPAWISDVELQEHGRSA